MPLPPPAPPLRWQGYLVKRSINDPKPHWQRRWITLQGRTVYWFHGADKLKGQLELTEGTTVVDYDGQDLQPRSSAKAREKAVEDHPFAFVVQTPEHKRVELAGLIMQVRAHTPLPSSFPGGDSRAPCGRSFRTFAGGDCGGTPCRCSHPSSS